MNDPIPLSLQANPEWAVLYQQLEDFQVHSYEAVPLAFLYKLARLNNWSASYTEQVFVEYKRFLFMAATVEHFVCPSEAVDQTWHFHLLYTRSYWDDLCGEILGKPLHHIPSRGGQEEQKAFLRDYGETLASYERLFGEKPPADIWEQPEKRLQSTPHLQLVNTRSYWLLPRFPRLFRWPEQLPELSKHLTIGLVGLCGLGLLLFESAGATALQAKSDQHDSALPIVIVTALIFILGSSIVDGIKPKLFSILPRVIIVSGMTLIPWLLFNSWFACLFLVVAFIFTLWRLRRCSECGQWNGLDYTGIYDEKNGQIEMRCSNCGHEAWWRKNKVDGGGGGCGGSGGG